VAASAARLDKVADNPQHVGHTRGQQGALGPAELDVFGWCRTAELSVPLALARRGCDRGHVPLIPLMMGVPFYAPPISPARRPLQARELMMKGCELCPTNEDVWLEAARLQVGVMLCGCFATAAGCLPGCQAATNHPHVTKPSPRPLQAHKNAKAILACWCALEAPPAQLTCIYPCKHPFPTTCRPPRMPRPSWRAAWQPCLTASSCGCRRRGWSRVMRPRSVCCSGAGGFARVDLGGYGLGWGWDKVMRPRNACCSGAGGLDKRLGWRWLGEVDAAGLGWAEGW